MIARFKLGVPYWGFLIVVGSFFFSAFSSIFTSQTAMVGIFNYLQYLPLLSNNCMNKVSLCSVCVCFFLPPKYQLSQHFCCCLASLQSSWAFIFKTTMHGPKFWSRPIQIQSSFASITLSPRHDGVSLQRKWKDCCWQINTDKSSWRDPSSFTQD